MLVTTHAQHDLTQINWPDWALDHVHACNSSHTTWPVNVSALRHGHPNSKTRNVTSIWYVINNSSVYPTTIHLLMLPADANNHNDDDDDDDTPTAHLKHMFYSYVTNSVKTAQCQLSRVQFRKYVNELLFWLEITVDNAKTVEVVKGKSQLCEVKLDIFLCKHHLQITRHQRYHQNPSHRHQLQTPR